MNVQRGRVQHSLTAHYANPAVVRFRGSIRRAKSCGFPALRTLAFSGTCHYKTCPEKPHQDALLPRVEMRLRRLQVGGFKAFAEAIVHRLQKAAGLGDTALILLQAREACGCSQLP